MAIFTEAVKTLCNQAVRDAAKRFCSDVTSEILLYSALKKPNKALGTILAKHNFNLNSILEGIENSILLRRPRKSGAHSQFADTGRALLERCAMLRDDTGKVGALELIMAAAQGEEADVLPGDFALFVQKRLQKELEIFRKIGGTTLYKFCDLIDPFTGEPGARAEEAALCFLKKRPLIPVFIGGDESEFQALSLAVQRFCSAKDIPFLGLVCNHEVVLKEAGEAFFTLAQAEMAKIDRLTLLAFRNLTPDREPVPNFATFSKWARKTGGFSLLAGAVHVEWRKYILLSDNFSLIDRN